MDESMIKQEILQSSVTDEMVHDSVESDWTDSTPDSSGTNHDVTELKHECVMDNSAQLGMNDEIENEKMGNSFIEPSSRMISNLIVIAPQDDNFDKCELFQTNTGPYSPCHQGVINHETTTPAMEQEIMDVVIKEEITQDVSKEEIADRGEIQNCKEYVKLGDDFSWDDKLKETVKTEAQPVIMKNKMSEDRLQKLIIKSESILEENTQPGLHTSDLPNLLPEGLGIILTDTGVWSTRFLPKGTEFSLYDHSAFSSHSFAAGHQHLDLTSSLSKSSEGYNVVAEKWESKIIYKLVSDIQPQTELILMELKATSNIDEMDTSCQELDTSVKIKDKRSAPKPHQCIECGKTFAQKGRLAKHMLTHSGERPHECIECGKTFKRKQHLVTHMLTHSGGRSHECKICTKFFFRADVLKQHMLTHSGDKPHECKQCGKFFSRSEHLRKHMLTHSGDKPHECKQCGKFFSQSGSLNVHMKSHTKERPFQCMECGLQFTLKGSLVTHRLTHSDDKHHGCKQCGKFFSHPGSLSRHMKSHREEKSH